jgi:hypothetical protein
MIEIEAPKILVEAASYATLQEMLYGWCQVVHDVENYTIVVYSEGGTKSFTYEPSELVVQVLKTWKTAKEKGDE